MWNKKLAVGLMHGLLLVKHLPRLQQHCDQGTLLQNKVWHSFWGEASIQIIILIDDLQVMNDEDGYVMFRGKQNTIITYNPETKIWTMKLVNNPSVYGTSSTSFQDLLMGWFIELTIIYIKLSRVKSLSPRTSRMDIVQWHLLFWRHGHCHPIFHKLCRRSIHL